MLAFALVLQVVAADSNYSSPALRDFVGQASIHNRAAPLTLTGYSADVESELALILRDSLGRETVAQLEQTAAAATWTRDGAYELHVRGYRSQSAGAPYSALTFARMYTVPTLYGNRLFLGMNDGIAMSKRDSNYARNRWKRDSVQRLDQLRTIHPLSTDRDRYYRFTGGDTVASLRTHDRLIRIVRVHVEPVGGQTANFYGFLGELDFDADRYQLVRMRGRLVNVSKAKESLVARSMGAVAVAYMEFENVEVNGKYWLPAYQRSEFQAQAAAFGDIRPVFRIVSRFRNYETRDGVVSLSSADSAHPVQQAPTSARLTFASKDSVSRYGTWNDALGTSTSQVTSEDFNDIAPDVWRPTGGVRVDYWPRRMDDVLRYNRVEGLFTGASGTVKFRDRVPGLRASANAGWAWTEQTVRGSGSVTLERGHWISGARAERVLASTNDFMLTFESGRSIGPLIGGGDNQDYVDRWIGAVTETRILGNVDRAMLTGEVAFVEDRVALRNVTTMPFSGRQFLPNRNSWPGKYARLASLLEWHPRVTGESLSPGVGLRLLYELNTGELDWQRVEARLAARRFWGGFMAATSANAGMILGDHPPPQSMYELGGYKGLESYGYKEFGGDRAALATALVGYHFPFLRTPRRLGWLMLPGISPGMGTGVQGGWAEVSSQGARQALLALGGDGITPLSRPTDGVRATADVRITLLGDAIGFGMARAIDHPDRWKPFFGIGMAF